MKKIHVLFFVAVFVLLLTGCFTTVSVRTLAPSEVNLGSGQVIAVAPSSLDAYIRFPRRIPVKDEGLVVPIRLKNLSPSMDSIVAGEVTKHLSQSIYEALSEGVYPIVSPAETNRYMKSGLRSHGVTLLLESSIDYIDFDEHIEVFEYKNSEGKVCTNYYLYQSGRLGFSYRLIDTGSGKVVDAHSYSAGYPLFQSDKSMLLAQVDENGTLTMAPYWNIDCEEMFNDIIDSFKKKIRNRLVPHAVKLSFSLMDGKNKEYEEINALVDDGYLDIALDKYRDIYETTGEIYAGYNYAVLYYAQGYPQEAIDIVQSIYKLTLDADAGKLLTKMTKAYSADKEAKEQAGI